MEYIDAVTVLINFLLACFGVFSKNVLNVQESADNKRRFL